MTGTVPPKVRFSSRWVRVAAIGIGALVVVFLGVVALAALGSQSSRSLGGPAKSLACSPQPCLNVQSYTLWVSKVTESDGVLRMQVAYRNASSATHASPEDLRLTDAQHRDSPSIQDAPGCTHWSRTEFANGARYGPITVCFRPASLAAPLTLNWSPDLGLICCTADLRIK